MAVVSCPECGKQVTVEDDRADVPARCAACAGRYSAETQPPAPLRQQAPRRPDDDYDDEDDEYPERRRRPSGAPHRGGLVMAFGIISVVLFMSSIGAAVAVGAFASPLSIVGLVLGILAWIWGGADIAKMRAGAMDERGLGNTQAGYYCGIVGTILNALGLLCGCLLMVVVIGILGFALTTAARMPAPPTRVLPPPPPPVPKKWVVASPIQPADYLPSSIPFLSR